MLLSHLSLLNDGTLTRRNHSKQYCAAQNNQAAVADWPTGKPGNFPVRPFGFAAWRPHKDNRQFTEIIHFII